MKELTCWRVGATVLIGLAPLLSAQKKDGLWLEHHK